MIHGVYLDWGYGQTLPLLQGPSFASSSSRTSHSLSLAVLHAIFESHDSVYGREATEPEEGMDYQGRKVSSQDIRNSTSHSRYV
jgi:hypothetical protein